MTAREYDRLLASAAQSIAEAVASGDDDAELKASTFAIEGVLVASLPDEAARVEALKRAFSDAEDLIYAVLEVAFDVGVAYGQRLGLKREGQRDEQRR